MVISGGTAVDSSGVTYQFPPGGFRFPFLAPGYYQIRVTPLAGHTAPSTDHTIGAPYVIWPDGSYGGIFQIVSGPAIKIDIPVDPTAKLLWLTKDAGKYQVSAGEYLSYELHLENNDTVRTFTAAVVIDKLPAGFRYQQGSTRINGVAAPDPLISPDGSSMTFALGDLAPSSATTIRYVVAIGAGAKVGTATNTAVATASPLITSNTATKDVLVQEPFMMSRNIIMGRVIVGACSDNIDDNKKGMEGIGIYLEDGTFVYHRQIRTCSTLKVSAPERMLSSSILIQSLKATRFCRASRTVVLPVGPTRSLSICRAERCGGPTSIWAERNPLLRLQPLLPRKAGQSGRNAKEAARCRSARRAGQIKPVQTEPEHSRGSAHQRGNIS